MAWPLTLITISPGFVNCHCHLELSHLKNVIPPNTGLIDFLCSVVTKRDFPQEVIQEEIIKAEKEMYENGIVAVGDIGNTSDTLDVKKNSKIWWQNFVEVLSLTDEKAEDNFIFRGFINKLKSFGTDSIRCMRNQRCSIFQVGGLKCCFQCVRYFFIMIKIIFCFFISKT